MWHGNERKGCRDTCVAWAPKAAPKKTAPVDHMNCKDWNCAQWCEHYDAKYDSVYAASGCNEDGDDCNCE